MTYNILYQSDKNTQIGLGISITSLLVSNKSTEAINIYVIDDGIDPLFLSQLKNLVHQFGQELFILSSQSLLNHSLVKQYPNYTGIRKNKHSYLKLFWELVINEPIDRLLYVDCDTLITNDLSDLFSINMHDNGIGMALDSLISNEITYIGLSKDDLYYNSGVILFDCNIWKEQKFSYRIIAHTKKVHSYGTVDQDILNVEFRNQICTLPIMYNYQTIHLLVDPKTYQKEFPRKNYYSYPEINILPNQVCIYHLVKFMGQNVWDISNMHPGKPIFERYLKLSPWAEYNPQSNSSTRGIYRVEKILFKFLPRVLFIKLFHIAHKKMITNSSKKISMLRKV